ncbi:hypothetical protein GQ600_2040 [Phytophthora cactorum]|nr:hypothetical protein GQ600_2040 [Phytophthora cactorum]
MRAAGFLARRLAAASGRRTMSSAHAMATTTRTACTSTEWQCYAGFEHPWDHGHGHHDDHAEAAHLGNYALVDGKLKYERSEIGAIPMPVEIDDEEESEESTDVLDDLHDEDEE